MFDPDDHRLLALAHPDSMTELTMVAGSDPEQVELGLHRGVPRGRVLLLDRARYAAAIERACAEVMQPLVRPPRPPSFDYLVQPPWDPRGAVRITGI